MFTIQSMQPTQHQEVARLIHDSTNGWYLNQLGQELFTGGPQSTMLFCDVYEALDPGCCLIAVADRDRMILGSCFYHPRETHISLGIMNVHPSAFGQGVARQLLQRVIDVADEQQKPVRLVSSTMNLDSFSLYTKAGFVPRQMFQDMVLDVPLQGIGFGDLSGEEIRDASSEDLPAMADLEYRVAHIRREKDYRFFVAANDGMSRQQDRPHWHTSVLYRQGEMQGWMVSIVHAGSQMVGPAIAQDESVALSLLQHELNHRAGNRMVFLVPVECQKLVQTAYAWGAKNCELHVAQVRGAFRPYQGVCMPTFMPETG